MSDHAPLLQVSGLRTTFATDDGEVAVLDDVGFEVHAGRTLASVGESGCGKRVTSLSVMGLLGSIPRLDVERDRLASIEGQVPPPHQRPPGCAFAERCPFADATCRAQRPALRDLGDGHASACHKAPLDPDVLLATADEVMA